MKRGHICQLIGGVVALIASGCSVDPAVGKNRSGIEVVAIAEKMVGSPYRYGGSSPAGFDCSGLVQYSFSKAGHPVPRETGALYARARKVDVSDLRPGDLLFFRIEGKVSHVGIYVDGDKFIHAPSSGKAVGYASLTNPYWKKRLVKAGRI